MDFIIQLLKTKAGFDAIVIFVDTFSKMTHFAPTMTTATAPDTARLFFDNVFKLHGVVVLLNISQVDSKQNTFTLPKPSERQVQLLTEVVTSLEESRESRGVQE